MDLFLAVQLFFVFVLFKFYLKFTFQIETPPFAVAIDISIDHRIYVLKNVLLFSQNFLRKMFSRSFL